jgi:presenilin enhancer 2
VTTSSLLTAFNSVPSPLIEPPPPLACHYFATVYWFGFAFLPLLWLMNVWLFWPDFRSKRDAVLAQYTRRSAIALGLSSLIYFPWMLFFAIGGQSLGAAYGKLDVTNFQIMQYLGLG